LFFFSGTTQRLEVTLKVLSESTVLELVTDSLILYFLQMIVKKLGQFQ